VAPAAAASAAASAPAAPMSPARAAINAALEAARAASRPGARSGSSAAQNPATSSATNLATNSVTNPAAGAPSPAVAQVLTPAVAAPAMSAASTPVAPSVPPATAMTATAPMQPAAAPAASPAARPAPWEDLPAGAAATAVLEAPVQQVAPAVAAQPQAVVPAPAAAQQSSDEDDLPPWVTEFSDDSAVAPAGMPAYMNDTSAPSHAYAEEAPAVVMPARAAPAPAKAPYAYQITAVPELDWDGNWPAVAAALPLRGVAQQLAMQAELISCSLDANAHVFKLRVPIETWRTPGNVEKLNAALNERFGRSVRVDTELGPVWYTASAEAQAHRAACQRAAEETVANDPFINAMIREFDAWVVPGSIVPPPASTTLH